MNSPISLLRLMACLAMFSARMTQGSLAITAQPASVAVTFPVPLSTIDLPESKFLGAYLLFTPGPGPFPLAFPTQLAVLFSRTGNGYTGLGTSGQWLYRATTNGGAAITFLVNEDGGRLLFYRDYLLQTNGTYQVFSQNRDDERVLYQAGAYRMFDYEGPASRVTTTFSVAVDSPGVATFQWYFDGATLEDGISSPFIYYFESIVPAGRTSITGAHATTLSISNVTRGNAGSYYCVVTTPSGSVTSAVVTLTVNGHATRDLTRPTVHITVPDQSEFVGRDPIHVTYISGTASDDSAVGSVFLLLGTNHYGPMPLGPLGDSKRDSLWSGIIQLAPGSNYLGAYAVDVYGNRSQTNSRILYYQSNSLPTEITLHLSIDGGGVVTPLTNGQRILLGQLYELRATPLPGYHFVRWSEGPFWESSNPFISFIAEDGQSFTAHFEADAVTNPVVSPRPGLLTFDTLTNESHGFPIFSADGDDLARLMISGPYQAMLPTGWNPNNSTPALQLDSSVAGNYGVTLSGIRAPFALKGFDVVSGSGSFTLMDMNTGARYEHDGSTGHVSLGKAFRRSVYVDVVVNGQVVLDNIEYRLLEHAPVARIKVQNELKLPAIDDQGHTLFNDSPPSHLEGSSFYQYPGYQGFWHYVLAPGTNPVPFVLDASKSRDPDGNALKFSWSYYTGGEEGDFYPLAGGVASRSPFYRNRPPVLGNFVRHELIVTVEDRYLADRLWFGVVVLRPQDAASFMWDWLHNYFDTGTDPLGVVQQHLIPVLREAESEFAAGDTRAGRRSLRQFELLAKLHLRRLDPMVTRALLAFTDAVLDVTGKNGWGIAD